MNAPASKLGRMIALILAGILFVASTLVFLRSGDWVASVFALGSLAYFRFFFAVYPRMKP